MDKRQFKDKVYTILASLVKAMANPHRLEIIDLLSQGERSVQDIATETGMSIANTSQHLQMLKQSSLVDTSRKGNFIYYRLKSENVYKAWRDLRAIGRENLPEVDKIIQDFSTRKSNLAPITLPELMTRIQHRNVVLLDVRPEQEFDAGHIDNAINIPIDQLATRLGELNKSKQYIAYCRGVFCVFADDAVQLLTARGYKVLRLDEGYADWKIGYAAKAV